MRKSQPKKINIAPHPNKKNSEFIQKLFENNNFGVIFRGAHEFNESGNAFLIEEGGMIEDLQSSTLAVIESSNKITLSHYSTRYEELYVDSSIIESGQHTPGHEHPVR